MGVTVSALLRVSVVVALAAVLACVPACGKKDGAGKIKIGVVTNCTADFWSICEAGANKAATEHNVELQFRQPEKAFCSRPSPAARGGVTSGQELIPRVRRIL